MAKQPNINSSACKLQTNLELKVSIAQQTQNTNARDDNLNVLFELKQKNPNRLLIGYLKVNSICSKLDQMKCLLKGKIDILTVTESRLDSSFITTQFLIDGYSEPFRFDRNRNGRGFLFCM